MATPIQVIETIAISGAVDETIKIRSAGSNVFISISLTTAVTVSETVTVSHNGAVVMTELFPGKSFTYRATDLLVVEDDTIEVEWANTGALSGNLEIRLGA